jgi:inhibitor of KinA sporulation pathway (predicted exonuclease)
MAEPLEYILVLDVESTCWAGAPPSGEISEIIEIGACLLKLRSLERSGKRSVMVKPQSSRISPFCTELTTITEDDVADAGTLQEACALLREEFGSRDRPWASYGNYDRHQFKSNCAHYKVDYPFGRSHVNVKNLFALSLGLPKAVGMSAALNLLGMPLEGTHHRGVDDAWNIAGILSELLAAARQGLPEPTRIK